MAYPSPRCRYFVFDSNTGVVGGGGIVPSWGEKFDFIICYLKTYNSMKDAMRLYQKKGFIKIPGSLLNTGHLARDTFYQLDLSENLIA